METPKLYYTPPERPGRRVRAARAAALQSRPARAKDPVATRYPAAARSVEPARTGAVRGPAAATRAAAPGRGVRLGRRHTATPSLVPLRLHAAGVLEPRQLQ